MKDEGEAMTEHDSPVTEDELHAYVDGELPADRSAAVASWLAAHPEQAATVAAWQAQADSIRARYGAVAGEPVPVRLTLDQIMRQSRPRRSLAAFAAVAAVAAFVLGGAAGWMARGASAAAPSSAGSLTADAIEAHKLYVVEVRHPVEVPGNERAHMTAWLSKRLGYAQRIPDLQSIGLTLVGGRLLPGPTGAAALYMYEGASGERFTLYCAKATEPESALRFKAARQFAAFTWVDGKVGYVVSGPDNRDRLEKVTKTIYEQVDKSGARKS
jgi:anti-sigma factor RsiW